jgi:hypothetical protein
MAAKETGATKRNKVEAAERITNGNTALAHCMFYREDQLGYK